MKKLCVLACLPLLASGWLILDASSYPPAPPKGGVHIEHGREAGQTAGIWVTDNTGRIIAIYSTPQGGPTVGFYTRPGKENDGCDFAVSVGKEGPVMQIRGPDGKLRFLNMTKLADAQKQAEEEQAAAVVLGSVYLTPGPCPLFSGGHHRSHARHHEKHKSKSHVRTHGNVAASVGVSYARPNVGRSACPNGSCPTDPARAGIKPPLK